MTVKIMYFLRDKVKVCFLLKQWEIINTYFL